VRLKPSICVFRRIALHRCTIKYSRQDVDPKNRSITFDCPDEPDFIVSFLITVQASLKERDLADIIDLNDPARDINATDSERAWSSLHQAGLNYQLAGSFAY